MDENIQEPTPENSEPIPAPGPAPEQPVVAQDAQIVPTEAPKEKRKSSVKKFTTFDKLPEDVRTEFHKILWTSTAKAAKEWFTQKYGVQFPEAANLTVFRYQHYKRLQKERQNNEVKDLQNLAEVATAASQVIGNTSLNLSNRCASIQSLVDLVQSLLNNRIKNLIETNYPDPMQDAVIQKYIQLLRDLSKDFAQVQVQLSQQASTDNFPEFEKFWNVTMAGVKNAYQITHKNDSKWDLFYNELRVILGPMMMRYRLVKDAVLK